MASRPPTTSFPQRAFAALFAAAFFAALPLWFLSTQDGPVGFACGGTPWQCEVTHHWLWRARVERYQPTRVRTASHTISYKSRRGTAWQLVFETKDASLEVLDSITTNEQVKDLASELEAARSRGETIARELAPDATYDLVIGLVLLFGGVGAGIVLLTERRAR